MALITVLLLVVIALQLFSIFRPQPKKGSIESAKEITFEGRKTFKIVSIILINTTNYYVITDVSNPKEPKIGILSENNVFNSETDGSSHGISPLIMGELYIMSDAPISENQKGQAGKIFAERILKE
ncbi:MAG: hypothetical protein JWM20_99 [Patescibacteria group bacterium]|nr:hypothetical protein [Patescibacteria group bacterium]